MADVDNNAWGNGRTPSPRRDDGPPPPRDNYGGDQRMDDRPPRRDGGGAQENPGNNLHVSGLAIKTTDTDLEEIFGKFGKIEKAQIMKDPHSRDSRGFGFVTFVSPEDAEAAMAALNATTLDDKTIGVEKARRGRARTPTPGQYHGPPKARSVGYRPYEPRRDDRFGGGRRDDRRGPPGSMAAPMRDDRRDDRRGGYDDRRDDRRGDDRRYDDRRVDSRYDDRRGGGDDRRGGDYGRRDRDYDDRRRDNRDEPRRY